MTLGELKQAVTVLEPGDAGYEEEVTGFNLATRNQPDVVVAVESEQDVVAAVRYAAANHIPVHVQATGHGAHVPVVGGMLISTKRLDTVSIDPASRTATIGAGSRWAPVVAAAAEHGLAAVTGSSPSVGAVGYLLGGGYGPLVRSHGVSSDYVRGYRIVTPDGELHDVDASEADLFWALRGGKGGFGVVTEVRVELVPLTELYAGSLIFEGEAIDPAYRAWLAFTKTAADDVNTSAALFHFPPIDLVPEVFRGKDLLMVRFAYVGDLDEGERLAAPLRAAAPIYLDNLSRMVPADMGLIHNDPADPGPSWTRGTLLDDIDDTFVATVLEQVAPGTPFIACEVRHVGGKAAVDVPGGSSVGGRGAKYSFFVIGAPDPSLFAQVIPAAADRVFAAIEPWVAPETTINWAGGPESPEFAKAWSPETTERLEAIRAAGDPDGIFAYRPVA